MNQTSYEGSHLKWRLWIWWMNWKWLFVKAKLYTFRLHCSLNFDDLCSILLVKRLVQWLDDALRSYVFKSYHLIGTSVWFLMWTAKTTLESPGHLLAFDQLAHLLGLNIMSHILFSHYLWYKPVPLISKVRLVKFAIRFATITRIRFHVS